MTACRERAECCLRCAAAGVGAYLGRRSPVGQAEYVTTHGCAYQRRYARSRST